METEELENLKVRVELDDVSFYKLVFFVEIWLSSVLLLLILYAGNSVRFEVNILLS